MQRCDLFGYRIHKIGTDGTLVVLIQCQFCDIITIQIWNRWALSNSVDTSHTVIKAGIYPNMRVTGYSNHSCFEDKGTSYVNVKFLYAE